MPVLTIWPGCMVPFLGMPREGRPFIAMVEARGMVTGCKDAGGIGSHAEPSRSAAETNAATILEKYESSAKTLHLPKPTLTLIYKDR